MFHHLGAVFIDCTNSRNGPRYLYASNAIKKWLCRVDHVEGVARVLRDVERVTKMLSVLRGCYRNVEAC